MPPLLHGPTHSSYVDAVATASDARRHIQSVDETKSWPYNNTLNRFDNRYWIIDYNALMVATMIPLGSRSFKVPAQWRTNADFLGVRWVSADNYNHFLLKYEEDNDYSGLVLAFRTNCSEPEKFTVTITDTDGNPNTYKLTPYALDPVSNRYVGLDPTYGTGRTYPADIIEAGDYTIPEALVSAYGSTDYIFILDFDDLRIGYTYTGSIVDPKKIAQVSFDCIDSSNGLGQDAYVARMTDIGNGQVQIDLGGVTANSVLTAGDKLIMVWDWHNPGETYTYSLESQFEVVSYTGFGQSAMTVIATGTMPGEFADCDAFYARSLGTATPVGVVNSVKYFTDLTLTGWGRKVLGQRWYEQEVHGVGMTSGFDDSYNLSPERQIEQVYALGYRKWWTVYIGMSHYFNGRTVYEDVTTGELVDNNSTQLFPVLFAGQSMAAIHFLGGVSPNRGIDAFQAKLSELFGVGYGLIKPINGAIGSTAADRAAAVNPDVETVDVQQTGDMGGLWWWDLDANKPGPILDMCVATAGSLVPKAILWAQGDQDAAAIMEPTGRNPLPSMARTKAATIAIFNYFRSLWGADLKIFIQEQAWGWGITDPALYPNNPYHDGTPTFLTCARNTWGDIVFYWKSYKDDPRNYSYQVLVYAPGYSDTVPIRTITVPGTQITEDGNYCYCDYPVELNALDAITAYGDQYPWGYINFRVVRSDNVLIRSALWSNDVPLDDTNFTKKFIVMGVNNWIGAYFTTMSDAVNHSANGAPGRKDQIAATTFRQAVAAAAGLRAVQVQPLNVSVGDSPINPMPYFTGFDQNNYWWNPDTNQPGPNLLAADALVKATGNAKVDVFVESSTNETKGLSFLDQSQWQGVADKWRTSNIAMLAWMRANWNNPELQVWMQAPTTTWWGYDTPPADQAETEAQFMRDAFTSIAKEGIGFSLGSYVPNANVYTTYYNEMLDGLGWIYYTVQGYHDAAQELGTAIGSNTNNVDNPPAWVLLRLVTGLKTFKYYDKSLRATWDARAGITHWFVNLYNSLNGKLIYSGVTASPSYVMTLDLQKRNGHYSSMLMHIEVAEYNSDLALTGPFVAFNGDTSGDLVAPTGITADRQANGDLLIQWNGRAGWPHFYFFNNDVQTSAVIAQGLIDGKYSYTWPLADQKSHYASTVAASYASFDVAEYDASDGAISAFDSFSGAVNAPYEISTAVTLLAIYAVGAKNQADFHMSWADMGIAGTSRIYQVTIYNTVDGSVIGVYNTTSNSYIWTLAAQVAVYGFGVEAVHWGVNLYDPTTGVAGPVTDTYRTPKRALAVTGGFGVRTITQDIYINWNPRDSVSWKFQLINVVDGSILKDVTLAVANFTWSAADQTAAYGYLATNIQYKLIGTTAAGATSDLITFTQNIPTL